MTGSYRAEFGANMSNAVLLCLLFMQVSNEYRFTTYRSRRRFLLVPYPSDFYDMLFVLRIPYLAISNIMTLLLILSGNVELYPVLFSPE